MNRILRYTMSLIHLVLSLMLICYFEVVIVPSKMSNEEKKRSNFTCVGLMLHPSVQYKVS